MTALKRNLLPIVFLSTVLANSLAHADPQKTVPVTVKKPTTEAVSKVAATAFKKTAPAQDLSKVKLNFSKQHDIEPRAVQSMAAVASKDSIDIVFYGGNRALLKDTIQAVKEAKVAGLPIGTIYLAQAEPTKDGKSTMEGVRVFTKGQQTTGRMAVTGEEVASSIKYAQELKTQFEKKPTEVVLNP